MLYSMLLPYESTTTTTDADGITRLAEATRQLVRHRIRSQQANEAHRYDLQHRQVVYRPGEHVGGGIQLPARAVRQVNAPILLHLQGSVSKAGSTFQICSSNKFHTDIYDG